MVYSTQHQPLRPDFTHPPERPTIRFACSFSDFSTKGNEVHLPSALIQPMAAEDAASAVRYVATSSPVNGTVEVGGPEQFHLEFAQRENKSLAGVEL